MSKPADTAKATAERRGPIRNGLESIGMAVLMAVLLKYFALEAYVIPTPSMQPTMMGSPEAGESDRILVDKFYYLLHEPELWDIVVFRYPVRKIQSYVKRIVGVGGDRLRIIEGNLYNVESDGSLKIRRKPERIQPTLWREIYPMRWRLERLDSGKDPHVVPTTADIFNQVFRGRGGKWTVDADGAFIGKPSSSTMQLVYSESARNDYVDGYDLESASIQKKNRGSNVGTEAVHDLAIQFALTPATTPDQLTLEIDLGSVGMSFRLEVKAGEGRLIASRRTPAKTLSSDPFPFPLPAGEETEIRFEHRDDRLFAYHNGEVQTFDVDELPVLTKLDLGSVVPKVTVVGKGECKFADVRIERDLHYTRSQLADDEIIEVPEGHFFMMGDNTLGSADGRDWTAIQIGVDAEGNIVDPNSSAAVRKLWGNKRPRATYGDPEAGHDDDNPVPLLNDSVIFVDEVGEIHALKGKVDHRSWGTAESNYRVEFLAEQPWKAPERPERFVPREHIQGRPIARFLRSLSGFKFFGWIR